MASNITVDTLTKGSTTLNTDEIVDTNSNQICKAWVNFNGTGTVAIRDSYNVSSITDNGSGNYSMNFATAMASIGYSANANCIQNEWPSPVTSYMDVATVYKVTTTYLGIWANSEFSPATAGDCVYVSATVFGD